MTRIQIEAEAQKYLDSSVTLNPFLIQDLGIIKNRCLIQTDVYKLSCVPYTLSMKDCKVLLILSPREQDILTGGKKGHLIFHMEFKLPDQKKEIPLFIRIQMLSLTQLNNSRNQCLLTGGFLNPPLDYLEVMARFFQKRELFQQRYKTVKENSRIFKYSEIGEDRLGRQVLIRREDGEKISARIISLSLTKATLYIDTNEEELLALPPTFLAELNQKGVPFSLNASLTDFTASAEVEGFFLVKITMEFSHCLTDCLGSLF